MNFHGLGVCVGRKPSPRFEYLRGKIAQEIPPFGRARIIGRLHGLNDPDQKPSDGDNASLHHREQPVEQFAFKSPLIHCRCLEILGQVKLELGVHACLPLRP